MPKQKQSPPGLVEIITITIVLILLWNFTDFKAWLLDEGGIVKVIKEMLKL